MWEPVYGVDGPHPYGQWGVYMPNEYVAEVVSWMSANHGEFEVLFHPNTGYMVGGEISRCSVLCLSLLPLVVRISTIQWCKRCLRIVSFAVTLIVRCKYSFQTTTPAPSGSSRWFLWTSTSSSGCSASGSSAVSRTASPSCPSKLENSNLLVCGRSSSRSCCVWSKGSSSYSAQDYTFQINLIDLRYKRAYIVWASYTGYYYCSLLHLPHCF